MKSSEIKLFFKLILNLKILIILSILQVFSGFSQNDWAPTNGPYGGYCNRLNLINNEVYSATTCGIYSTSDNGLSWTSRNNGLAGTSNNYGCVNFQDIEIINNKLIAGTYDAGIYISADNGLNWTQSNTGLLGGTMENLNLMIRDVYINGSDILIGTQNGVFKSTNQGQSWAPSNIGINEPSVNNSQAQHFVKFGTAIFLQTAIDIYRSMDNGFTWVDLNNNFGAQIFTLVSNTTGIYVSGNLGIYKSTNNGNSWSIISNNLPDVPTTIFESNNNLYCGVPNFGTYFSTNNGLSWTQIANDFYTDFLFVNGTHYLCKGSGVYSFGLSLALNNCGLGAAKATNNLFVDGNDLYSGTANGIYKSTDEGNIWKNMRNNLPLSTFVNCITRSGNNLIIGTKDSGIFLSNDNGATWNQSNNGLVINGEVCLNISMLHYSNGKVFLGAKQNIPFWNYGSLFVSSDNGQTWTIANNGLGNNFNITSMTDFGQSLILGTANTAGGVFLSTDSGNSWLFDGLGYAITDVAANSNEYYAISGQSAFSTQNMGNTWVDNFIGICNCQTFNIEKLNSIVVIQTSNLGTYYLNNGDWEAFGNIGILGGNNKTICQKQNGAIFIGASAYSDFNNGFYTYVENGVSKYIGNPLGINEHNESTVTISPNPTSSEITINSEKFSNEAYSLCDQMGRVVGSGKLSGTNTIISLSSLSKGIYLLKVEGDYESAMVVKE
jgi:photosystem II stability/assembly factor-like uncharacterized protein